MYAQEPRQQPQQQQQNATDPEALLRLLIAPGEEDAVATLEWARLHVPSNSLRKGGFQPVPKERRISRLELCMRCVWDWYVLGMAMQVQ